jgi:hypothetical protein
MTQDVRNDRISSRHILRKYLVLKPGAEIAHQEEAMKTRFESRLQAEWFAFAE